MALVLNGDGKISGANLNIDSDGAATFTGLTVGTATAEENAVLVKDNSATDIGSLRINNGAFIVKGYSTSQPVQLQTHDGNEDIEVDPDGFIKMETAGLERMRIDASGRVTMPYQVSGFFYLTNSQDVPNLSTQRVNLNSTGYAQNLSLDTGNHRVTVPVSGKYFVSAVCTFYYGEATHAGIYVNGSASAGAGLPNNWLQQSDYGTETSGQESMLNVRVVNLNANDYLELWAFQSSGSTKGLHNAGRTYLSIHLLG